MDQADASENADQELVNQLRNDDQQAWKTVYKDNRSKVINYLIRREVSSEIAEEIFHETLMILDKRKASLILTSKLSTFLIGIAQNLLFDHWKKNGKDPTTFTDDLETLDRLALGGDEEPTQLALLQLAFGDTPSLGEYDRDELLQRALSLLSEKCQKLFQMRFWEGLTDQQIAVAYPMEYRLVRDQIYKCKEKLKTIFTNLNKGNQ